MMFDVKADMLPYSVSIDGGSPMAATDAASVAHITKEIIVAMRAIPGSDRSPPRDVAVVVEKGGVQTAATVRFVEIAGQRGANQRLVSMILERAASGHSS